MDRALVLLKPDAVQRGLCGEIIGRLEGRGLKLAAIKLLRVDRELAGRHYAAHVGKPFFDGLIGFITSGPLVALVAEGGNAVEIVRSTMGATNPQEAAPGTIRGDLAVSIGRNLVHGSDSKEAAEAEIGLFFSAEEIAGYERDVDRWIIES